MCDWNRAKISQVTSADPVNETGQHLTSSIQRNTISSKDIVKVHLRLLIKNRRNRPHWRQHWVVFKWRLWM